MAPDGRDARIEHQARSLAALSRDHMELRQRHDDLVEGLCRYMPDRSGDERAVESVILEWAEGVATGRITYRLPVTYLAVITVEYRGRLHPYPWIRITRTYHVQPDVPEWSGTRYQVYRECLSRALESVNQDPENDLHAVLFWSLEPMELAP